MRLGTWTVAALSISALSLAVPSSASASAHRALPNACHTATFKSAEKLLGVHRKAQVTRTHNIGGHGADKVWSCYFSHGRKSVTVETSFSYIHGEDGAPHRRYLRPSLGPGGIVDLPTAKDFVFTAARYHKHGVYIYDQLSVTESHRGHRLYAFAHTQSRRFTRKQEWKTGFRREQSSE
jgi:hypothetical protein